MALVEPASEKSFFHSSSTGRVNFGQAAVYRISVQTEFLLILKFNHDRLTRALVTEQIRESSSTAVQKMDQGLISKRNRLRVEECLPSTGFVRHEPD